MAQGLALMDFDGTITSKDSLLDFMKYSKGKLRCYWALFIFLPQILYYSFRSKRGEVAKRNVMSFLFRGMSESKLRQLGHLYAKEALPQILLKGALREIQQLQKQNFRIIVISASFDIWIQPWTEQMGLELLCTNLEFVNEKFTGNFATPNCNGIEKVRRIKKVLKPEEYNPIYGYGNSDGDRPMLAIADEQYYRKFN